MHDDASSRRKAERVYDRSPKNLRPFKGDDHKMHRKNGDWVEPEKAEKSDSGAIDLGEKRGLKPVEAKQPEIRYPTVDFPGAGFKGLKIGEEVTLTIKARVTGYRLNDWDGKDRVTFELHQASMED